MRDLRYEVPEVSDLDVVAIAAHPSNIERSCGGVLLKMAEKGYRTGILDLTVGEMATGLDTGEQRLQESQHAASILQVEWRGNCRFPDARLDNTIGARMTLATILRNLRPKTLILPYWEARHPDHYRTSELGYEAAFLAGLQKLDEDLPAHRPSKVLYSAHYRDTKPGFVVDISRQFERRMEALFCYTSIYDAEAQRQVREHLVAAARFYGDLIGAKFGEPYIVKETMAVDDIVKLGSPTF
jgi:N-acetylglucosamine malate deacetylase 1